MMKYAQFPIPGILIYRLKELSQKHLNLDNPSVLDFGCGNGRFSKIISGLFDKSTVIGYDRDNEIITSAEKYENNNLCYTSEKPDSLFDVVVCKAVLHSNPKELIPEASSFVRDGGLVGVIDYDLNGYKFNIFKGLWGSIDKNEKELLKKSSVIACYEDHVKHKLKDYIKKFRNIGVTTLFADKGLVGINNTPHFVYIGIRNN